MLERVAVAMAPLCGALRLESVALPPEATSPWIESFLLPCIAMVGAQRGGAIHMCPVERRSGK